MVATSEGIPNLTMMKPLSQPITVPVSRAAQKARKTCRGMLPRPEVASMVSRNATMPIAMTDGNERSISAAITIMVSGIAMIAKNGTVDMKA